MSSENFFTHHFHQGVVYACFGNNFILIEIAVTKIFRKSRLIAPLIGMRYRNISKTQPNWVPKKISYQECRCASFLLIFSFFTKSVVIRLTKFQQLADLEKINVVCLAKKQKNQGKLIAQNAETYFSYQECRCASFILIFSFTVIASVVVL